MRIRFTTAAMLAGAVALAGCSSSGGGGGGGGGARDAKVARKDGGRKDGGGAPDLMPDLPPRAPLKIDRIIPADGFADGGRLGYTPVRVVGSGFKRNMTIYIDGGANGGIITAFSLDSPVSISFNMPKNPYGTKQATLVSIQIRAGSAASNLVDFQYTLRGKMSADYKAAVLTSKVTAYTDYPSEPIRARVFIKGKTDKSKAAIFNLRAEVGLGLKSKDPLKDSAFTWWRAKFVEQDKDGYHVYSGRVTPALSNVTYQVLYRFSKDGGKTYIYADTTEKGFTYSAGDATTIAVTKPPTGFCLTSKDCTDNPLLPVCKVNASDWKKNRCVGCLTAADCTKNKAALGPKCNTTRNLCYCSAAADCKGNRNGKKCMRGGYCGCTSDKDCDWVKKEKCTRVGRINLCRPGSSSP